MSPMDTARSDGEPIPNRELDIRGEVCPYTYVKTRLALEEMEVGQVLRVLVDYEPAVHNVPRSVRLQGDEVLKVEPVGEGLWAIWIRKQNPSI
ncbi:sulfurtransferase TusA family protein [Thermoflexus sp.]|uniref:sulfurtransferase TusA family protein n=1 Tax=Thermoflexus sp. TaxID=1969742 RepID=UPI003331D2B3